MLSVLTEGRPGGLSRSALLRLVDGVLGRDRLFTLSADGPAESTCLWTPCARKAATSVSALESPVVHPNFLDLFMFPEY